MVEEIAASPGPALPEGVQKAATEAFGNLLEKFSSMSPKDLSDSSSGSESSDEQPKSWFVDPYTLLDSMGVGYRQSPSPLTYETCRVASERDVTIASIIMKRVNQVSTFCRRQPNKYSVGFEVRPRGRDPHRRLTDSEREKVDLIENFLLDTGSEFNVERDNLTEFMKKAVRDSLTYDALAIEKWRSVGGDLHSFFAIDAATVRIANPTIAKGTPPEEAEIKRSIRYIQYMNAQKMNEYTGDELAYLIRNPRTNVKVYRYGFSEIEILMLTITSHLWAEAYNQKMFSQGSTVKGVLNLKGKINPTQLEMLRRQWAAQLMGIQNAWKTPVVNSDGVEFIPLQLNNQEMGYQLWMEYLIKVCCFPPDQRVRLVDGTSRRIDRVNPGDVVLTHVGRGRRVKNVQTKKCTDPLVGMRIAGREIRATAEHPFFVASSTLQQLGGDKVRRFEDLAWVRADEIVEGRDYLAVPKIREHYRSFTCKQIDLSAYVPEAVVEGDSFRLDHGRSWLVPRILPLTEENAYVLGLYAAEGCSTDFLTTFTFSKAEREYAELVHAFAKRLGVNSREYFVKDTVISVRFGSGVVTRAMRRLFGHGAKKKKIPQEIVSSPLPIQRAFLSGLFAGDGSVYKNSNGHVSFAFGSVSRRLAEQAQQMLLAQEVFASRYYWTNRGGFGGPRSKLHDLRVEGAQLKKMASWLVGAQGTKLRRLIGEVGDFGLRSKVYETESYFLVPVSETWREPYDGVVYNLEVEEDHTYVVDQFAVHNCAVYNIDPAEIGFDLRGSSGQQPMFMSNNEAQQKVSKDAGLQPLLRFLEDGINRHIVRAIDPRFELAFVGLDAKTEEQAQQLRMQQVQNENTLNEVRAMDDLPPVPDGDIVLNPVYVGWKQFKAGLAAAPASGGAGDPGGQDGGGSEAEQPPPTEEDRAFLSKPGSEERQAASRIMQLVAKPDGGEENGKGDLAGLEELLRDDWSSSVHAAVKPGDLRKSSRKKYDTFGLD